MKNPLVPLLVVLLLAGALAIYVLNRAPAPAPPAEETAATPGMPPAPPETEIPAASRAPAPAAAADAEEAGQEEAPAVDRVESAPLPPGYPRSRVPHRVASAWGRHDDGGPKGVVGMTIVVDPATSDAQLTALAEDVLAANCDAPMMSVRIYDSEDALDARAHKNHDPMIAEHTIAQIWVNPTDNRYRPKVRVKVRGQDVLLGADAMPAGDACNPGS